MTTHYLELDPVCQSDFALIGLSCPLRDYRLAWTLNISMDWSFEWIGEIEVEQKTGVSRHSRFQFNHAEDFIVFNLLTNRVETGFLLPEWNRFDFLLKVDGIPVNQMESLLTRLRRVPALLAALSLPAGKLRNKQRVILI